MEKGTEKKGNEKKKKKKKADPKVSPKEHVPQEPGDSLEDAGQVLGDRFGSKLSLGPWFSGKNFQRRPKKLHNFSFLMKTLMGTL